MTDTCPLCENEADIVADVGAGDSWRDVAGRPPHSLFSNYQMLHAVPQSDGSIRVFCHGSRRQQV